MSLTYLSSTLIIGNQCSSSTIVVLRKSLRSFSRNHKELHMFFTTLMVLFRNPENFSIFYEFPLVSLWALLWPSTIYKDLDFLDFSPKIIFYSTYFVVTFTSLSISLNTSPVVIRGPYLERLLKSRFYHLQPSRTSLSVISRNNTLYYTLLIFLTVNLIPPFSKPNQLSPSLREKLSAFTHFHWVSHGWKTHQAGGPFYLSIYFFQIDFCTASSSMEFCMCNIGNLWYEQLAFLTSGGLLFQQFFVFPLSEVVFHCDMLQIILNMEEQIIKYYHCKKNLLNCLQLKFRNSQEVSVVTPNILQKLVEFGWQLSWSILHFIAPIDSMPQMTYGLLLNPNSKTNPLLLLYHIRNSNSNFKKNLLNWLQLTCSMLQPSCHTNSTRLHIIFRVTEKASWEFLHVNCRQLSKLFFSVFHRSSYTNPQCLEILKYIKNYRKIYSTGKLHHSHIFENNMRKSKILRRSTSYDEESNNKNVDRSPRIKLQLEKYALGCSMSVDRWFGTSISVKIAFLYLNRGGKSRLQFVFFLLRQSGNSKEKVKTGRELQYCSRIVEGHWAYFGLMAYSLGNNPKNTRTFYIEEGLRRAQRCQNPVLPMLRLTLNAQPSPLGSTVNSGRTLQILFGNLKSDHFHTFFNPVVMVSFILSVSVLIVTTWNIRYGDITSVVDTEHHPTTLYTSFFVSEAPGTFSKGRPYAPEILYSYPRRVWFFVQVTAPIVNIKSPLFWMDFIPPSALMGATFIVTGMANSVRIEQSWPWIHLQLIWSYFWRHWFLLSLRDLLDLGPNPWILRGEGHSHWCQGFCHT
ncbi:hypothetical protein VP01_1744g4 [Puccinia sorghi]|uniref:Uncharacterized protein n=1 Tax=Puccinia sorghi TaxID=27349 RepID=A0A0L6VF86_9BASI|nr:hypothetical protein VP01_1744g4 [Puccinia sorghi]